MGFSRFGVFLLSSRTELSISGHPVVVPQGKIIKTGLTSTFNHNEFLVYDEGQVHMKYLLHVRWN